MSKLMSLYIPIWLYSNEEIELLKSLMTNFTFQSGYIQINADPTKPRPEIVFTFQSGYIQILSVHYC